MPTAPFQVFYEYQEALAYIENKELPFVIKADGLCAGKGAYVIKDMEEAKGVLNDLMVNAIYGDAGKRTVIEDFLPGVEASYLAFTDGETILPMSACTGPQTASGQRSRSEYGRHGGIHAHTVHQRDDGPGYT